MPTDQIVTAKHILQALLELKRQGNQRLMSDLEKVEPDLVEYILESLGLIHRQLVAAGVRPKPTLRLQRRIEGLVLVAVTALRQAHYQLWQGSVGQDLDPPDPAEPSPDPPS